MKRWLLLTALMLAACQQDPVATATPEVAATVRAILGQLPEEPLSFGDIKIAVWQDGNLRSEFWVAAGADRNSRHAMTELLIQGINHLARSQPQLLTSDLTLDVCLTHSWTAQREITQPDKANSHRGIRGVELSQEGRQARYCPGYAIRTNRSLDRVIERFTPQTNDLKARFFQAHQVLVSLPDNEATLLFRGQQVISPSAVTRDAVRVMTGELADWLLRNVSSDGRMTYKYWPSSGRESGANNMIRQFMATTALGRWRCFAATDQYDELITDNLAYNLKHYYREEARRGLIEFDARIKLGAISLAGLAIMENPAAGRYQRELLALRETTDYLQREYGRFQTFYAPAAADRNHNFYPGEALLFWSYLMTGTSEHCGSIEVPTDDTDRLQRFQQVVDYYRQWHLTPEQRNPAFVPWQTQAIYRVYAGLAPRDEDREFIFAMNDWLIDTMQQWEEASAPDMQGRFYSTQHRFGPPHASSTAVYLEGLIDAFRLAQEVGDEPRMTRYRQAIKRGLRSLLQLQFQDDIDMYYISQRDRTRGGMRTSVYNNEIRVDNVQHSLMAAMKILTHFTADDWRATDIEH